MKRSSGIAPLSRGLLALIMGLACGSPLWAESLEVNGDRIEYSVDGKKVIVTGNVEIKQLDTVLTSDYAEYTQGTNSAYARGNVVIVSPEKRIVTDEITYDFDRKYITASPTRIYAPPIYAAGHDISTNDKGQYVVKSGTFTMSDYDDPEYHFAASSMVVDKEKERVTGRNIRMKIGDVPVFYWPWYYKNLENMHNPIHHRYGKESRWGHYVLNRWDFRISEALKGSVSADYRELRGWNQGLDLHYDAHQAGTGMIRTNYMDEHNRTTKNVPMVQTERYFAEWRHAYKPDDDTHVTAQFFHLKDDGFLHEYFRRYDTDPQPTSYVAAMHHLKYGSLNGQVNPRTTDFYTQTEYLPQVRYDLPDVQLADSGVYWKNTTEAAYLDHRTANIAKDDKNNARLDTDQEFSYPIQTGVVNLTPFAGTKHTYFSKTLDPEENDAVRNLMRAGVSASTKFFRVYDVDKTFLGQEFHGIRHTITPDVTYEYMSDPTIDASNLYPFDDIDRERGAQSIRLSLGHKLQTKRSLPEKIGAGEEEPAEIPSVDIFRALIGTTYNLDKDNGLDIGFQTVDFGFEVMAIPWMTAAFSGIYDTDRGTVSSFNTDFTVSRGPWSVGTGYRYNRLADDIITTSLSFHPDRKWSMTLYERVNLQSQIWEEEEYRLTRNFHAWAVDMMYNHTNTRGEESWIVFRFKEFGEVVEPSGIVQAPDSARYYPKEVGVIDRDAYKDATY